MSTLLEQFTAEINSHFFLSEFSFDKNRFRAATGAELELADHVIALPDALFIFQIKGRNPDAPADQASIEKWFSHTVLKEGCGQIRDSLSFLKEQPHLWVENPRGHKHDLARLDRPVIPVLLYSSGSTWPERIRSKTHHMSKRAGFVHTMHIHDYYVLCHTLALPSELIGYFAFRKEILLGSPSRRWEEARLTAQFISESHDPLSDRDAQQYLRDAREDVPSFDMGPIFRRFGEKIHYSPDGGKGLDYYRVLEEISRLSRAEMRGLKTLTTWALEHAGRLPVQLPARMQSCRTGTGFVVVPIPEGAFENRLLALKNLANAAKYDSKLDRQIGVSVADDGCEIELDWIFMAYPWQHDSELEEALARHYPFRPKPKPLTAYRYPSSIR